MTDLSVTLGNIALTLQRTMTTLIQVRHVLSLFAKGSLLLRKAGRKPTMVLGVVCMVAAGGVQGSAGWVQGRCRVVQGCP